MGVRGSSNSGSATGKGGSGVERESEMWHPQKLVALLPSFPKSKSLRFMLTLFLSFLIDLCSPEINAPVSLTENETGTSSHKSFSNAWGLN